MSAKKNSTRSREGAEILPDGHRVDLTRKEFVGNRAQIYEAISELFFAVQFMEQADANPAIEALKTARHLISDMETHYQLRASASPRLKTKSKKS